MVLDKSGEKKNEKPECYQCKGFRHMKSECSNLNKEEKNDKRKEKEKEKRKKVLQASLESEDEIDLEEFLEKFCFMANDEEEKIEEELQATFEEMYQNFINVDKVNKDQKIMIQTLFSEIKKLKAKVT